MKRCQLATVIGAMMATALPTAVFAEEAEAEEVERIEVTGSRIQRIDMEGASPVTVLNADELKDQGFATVGDALRSSNLNAFGSWGGGANNGWSSQATVRLKGASSNHTLTLLDGHRMAKSPVLDGGASNINTIPMAAVDRIEILTDGASAIYGTDAIAGVVNVILKKDFEGVMFEGRLEEPDRDGGGNSNSLSFTGGLSSDKGNLVFTIEHYEQDKIMMKDRWFANARVLPGGDPTVQQDWTNISGTGRVLQQGAAGGWMWSHPFENEDLTCADVYGDRFIGVLDDANYPGDTLCGYDYAQTAALSAGVKRNNTLIHYNYELTDNIELTARAYWAANETLDLSAPVPVSNEFKIPQGLPAYTTAEGIELRELVADPDAGMSFRFDTAGNRRAEHYDNIFDYLLALNGTHGDITWDFAANYNRYTNHTWGTGYILTENLGDLVGYWDEEANEFVGWDPRDPNSEMPGGAAANFDKRRQASYLDISGGFSVPLFELPGGDVSMYLGAAYREEELDSKVDALAEAGKIKGGNGGSGGVGERDVKAAFFELMVPIIEDLELNVAGRYDDYSDFGSTFNPQVSIRYNVLDSLLVRASWGEGFRAPTLSDLYKGETESYGWVKNYVGCYENGEDISSCGQWESSVRSVTAGNKELQPEESESYNIGIVYEPLDNMSISIDYWKLETDGLIETIAADEIVKTQAILNQIADEAGQPRVGVDVIYPGASVELGGNGRLKNVTLVTANLGMSEREGTDVNFNYSQETAFGDFDLDINWSHYITYKDTYTSQGVQIVSDDWTGREDYPDDRINLTLSYTYGDHSLTYFANYIDEQKSWDLVSDDSDEFYYVDSITYQNITYSWNMPWNNRLSLGVYNLGDEDPKFQKNGDYNGSLYDERGRTYWVSFQQTF
ncbi:TonB-dependent receptor domain-containing protein [Ferrimonas aestuarii]|uniref:TonB-dependent receptor n=1 Tax=Ferrimonas aestuarii TaxID=2569539 RepID=A0A4U1BMC7_9GAMM|nr:TonB-dependent receptor [Ferrimonas aestuarii]TKB54678.1 TonB-dependent receptor [Ferrimonas aestuarii]